METVGKEGKLKDNYVKVNDAFTKKKNLKGLIRVKLRFQELFLIFSRRILKVVADNVAKFSERMKNINQ